MGARRLAEAAWSRARGALTVSTPDPCPLETFDPSGLDDVLARIEGPADLPALRPGLDAYLTSLADTDPDRLDGPGALAFWINAHNAIVLRTMADHPEAGSLREVPGAFTAFRWTVGGRRMSLDAIEHRKVRRFRDPRVHFALVCGSASCPPLRGEAYRAERLDAQLEDQARAYLAARVRLEEGDGLLRLPRLLRRYAGDFAYPSRMPSALGTVLALAHPSSLVPFVVRYLPPELAARLEASSPRVVFEGDDWRLACAVRRA